jgi:hypothetical protein
MNYKKIALWTVGICAAGGLGWYIYQYANLPKGLVINGVRANMHKGKILVMVSIYNASSVPLTINGGKVEIYLKDHNILDGTITEVTTIKAKASTDLSINIIPEWVAIGLTILDDGGAILQDLKDWNIEDLDLKAKGNIFLTEANVRIPFETKLIKG